MSYTNFLFHGLEGQQKTYRRDQYPQDSEIGHFGKDKTEPFTGKITKILQNNQSKTIYIDNAYKFSIVSDKIRNACSKIWTKLHNQTHKIFVATLLGGLAGIASAIAIGVVFPPLFPVAFAVGVVSLGILGFSCLAKHRANQAKAQQKLWADPTQNYIQKCREHDVKTKLKEQVNQNVALFEKSNREHFEKLKSVVQNLIAKFDEQDKKIQSIANESEEADAETSALISEFEKKIIDTNKQIQNEKNTESLHKLQTELDDLKNRKERLIKLQKSEVEFNRKMKAGSVETGKKINENCRETILSSLTNLMDLNVKILKCVSREDAYNILEPFYSKYPEVKEIADNL